MIYTDILEDMFVSYIHSNEKTSPKISEMVSALGIQLDSMSQFFIVPIALFSDSKKIGENATILLKDLNLTRQYMETSN